MAGYRLTPEEIGQRARALALAAQYLEENCFDTIPNAARWAADHIKKQSNKLYAECGKRQSIRLDRFGRL